MINMIATYSPILQYGQIYTYVMHSYCHKYNIVIILNTYNKDYSEKNSNFGYNENHTHICKQNYTGFKKACYYMKLLKLHTDSNRLRKSSNSGHTPKTRLL